MWAPLLGAALFTAPFPFVTVVTPDKCRDVRCEFGIYVKGHECEKNRMAVKQKNWKACCFNPATDCIDGE
jgi:hypothetical protein